MTIRIGFLGNCQVQTMAFLAPLMIPGADAITFDYSTPESREEPARRAFAERLEDCDIIFAQLALFSITNERELRERFGAKAVTISNFYFRGLFPDSCYIGGFGHRVENPSAVNSVVILDAFMRGMSEEAAIRSFNRENYERLGLLKAWELSMAEMRRREANNAVDVPGAEMMEGSCLRYPAFLTMNHPSMVMLADYLHKAFAHAGIAHQQINPALHDDPLDQHDITPIDDIIAEEMRLPYRGTQRWRFNALQRRFIGREELVRRFYATYRDTARDRLTVNSPLDMVEQYRNDPQLRFLVEATAPADPVPAPAAQVGGSDLRGRIGKLPPLDRHSQFHPAGACKICGGPVILFDRLDFNKFCARENYDEFGLSGILIDYLRCLSCGFIFTRDFDNWRQEDFAGLIYNQDYLKVDGEYVETRPAQYARHFSEHLRGCERARILDYGSGAGVFVERMRQAGFRDIQAYDPFSSPEPPEGDFDIITCFEVIEHSSDPAGTLAAMKALLRADGCILFSQTLQPPDILSVRGSWWYLAPRNGHISAYTAEALAELARQQNLVFHKGEHIFAFTQAAPSRPASVALRCAGPSFAVLRLTAPPDTAMTPPGTDTVLWHKAEDDGIWRFRWTAASSLAWEARWSAVECLQVRLPLQQEVEPRFGLRCELELAGQRRALRLDRGELCAEFDVQGVTAGQIMLHTPKPLPPSGDRNGVTRGLAIGISHLPGPLMEGEGPFGRAAAPVAEALLTAPARPAGTVSVAALTPPPAVRFTASPAATPGLREEDGLLIRDFAPRPDKVSRILVLKLDHLGDFIIGLPALRDLRQHFPSAYIRLICGRWNVAAAAATGLFDDIRPFDYFPERAAEWTGVTSAPMDLFAQAAEGSFDLAIDLRVDEDTRALLGRVDAALRCGIGSQSQFPMLDIALPDVSRQPIRLPQSALAPAELGRDAAQVLKPGDFLSDMEIKTDAYHETRFTRPRHLLLNSGALTLPKGQYAAVFDLRSRFFVPGLRGSGVRLEVLANGAELLAVAEFGRGSMWRLSERTATLRFASAGEPMFHEFRVQTMGRPLLGRLRFSGLRLLRLDSENPRYRPSELHVGEKLGLLVSLIAQRTLPGQAREPRRPAGGRLKIVLAPFSNSSVRDWPAEQYAALAGLLAERLDCAIEVIGAPAQVPQAAALMVQMPAGLVTDRVGKTQWSEMAGILREADLVICNNSGIAHQAAQLGARTLAIYSASHQPTEWGPRGPASRAIMMGVACSPCGFERVQDCPHDHLCMKLITPEAVLAQAMQMLANEEM